MILLLGGTAEARALAASLHATGVPFTSSLAGRVSNPRLPPGEVRIGGFGGAAGLSAYLREHAVTAVVDATHPFAARITANAAAACQATGIPLLVLHRPPWEPVDGDDWRHAAGITAAAHLISELPPSTNVLLTTGRQEVPAFAALPQRFWLRAVDPPDPPLPARCEVILDRGPYGLDGERALLRGKDVLVTKNSGGPMTAPKLQAARELAVPVVMIARPPVPPGVPTTTTPEGARAWLAGIGG